MNPIDNLSIQAIRALSADGVQKANSGHPGLPLGCAPVAYELYKDHLQHNPKNPSWKNRDRFVLSGGHGSMLLYSMLHLYGYGGLSLEDLKNFRQWGAKTPGHPEYGHTVGVEATTGPLGAGLGMAVGMAAAEAHLASLFNREGFPVVDHYTYVLAGDGCMMEGISSEVLSLAGTWKLNKLIVLYDSNKISIEGDTDIAFTENVEERMKAFGFGTLTVEDGNDIDALSAAIEEAKKDTTRPYFIAVKTVIGYGSPKAGKASSHGEPLGEENVREMKKTLNYPSLEPFYVPEEVYENFRNLSKRGEEAEEKWNRLFEEWSGKYPELRELYDRMYEGSLSDEETEDLFTRSEKPLASRVMSGNLIQKLKDKVPALFGGSADLAPSTKTLMNGEGSFSAENYAGRNLHFGVRELGMTAIANGMLLHGGLRTYVSTFFVFSDYVKPMARLSALMKIPQIFVFTHDSIGVGEDGPTHEPIEQLAMLRAMPSFHVFRPADEIETAAAWVSALQTKDTPTALVLTRQNLPILPTSSREAAKGAYILKEAEGGEAELILIASGSEVSLCLEAAETLQKEGRRVRVVSMPSMDVFEEQSEEYKEKILPKKIRARVAVEALSTFGWERYTGLDGKVIGMTTFGASAPADRLMKEFGFTAEHVLCVAKDCLENNKR